MSLMGLRIYSNGLHHHAIFPTGLPVVQDCHHILVPHHSHDLYFLQDLVILSKYLCFLDDPQQVISTFTLACAEPDRCKISFFNDHSYLTLVSDFLIQLGYSCQCIHIHFLWMYLVVDTLQAKSFAPSMIVVMWINGVHVIAHQYIMYSYWLTFYAQFLTTSERVYLKLFWLHCCK